MKDLQIKSKLLNRDICVLYKLNLSGRKFYLRLYLLYNFYRRKYIYIVVLEEGHIPRGHISSLA